jgi:hypothetical protein
VVALQQVWFLTRGGKLHVRNLSDGQERGQHAFGAVPSGGVLMAGKHELVPAGKGTIRPVAIAKEGDIRP